MNSSPLPPQADGNPLLVEVRPWRRGIAIGVGLALTAYFLWRVHDVLPPFLIAFFLASLLDPLVVRVQKRGVSRGRAVLSIFLFVFLVLLCSGWVIMPRALNELTDLGKNLPEYGQHLTGDLQHLGATADRWYEEKSDSLVPLGLTEKPSAFLSSHTGPLASAATRVLDSVKGAVVGFLGQVLWLIIIPLALFYFLLDYPRLRERLIALVAPGNEANVDRMAQEVVEIFSAYFRSLTIVCLFYGIAAGLLFAVLGLPYALFLGIAAGVLYAVPYVGPFLAMGSAVVVSLTTGGSVAHTVLVLICFLLMHFSFDYGITPRVVGGSVGLHPVVNIFALMCGATLFGVWGMLLAVPVAASVQMLLLYFIPRLRHTSAAAVIGAEPVPSSESRPDEIISI